jgi:phosphohistidine phosphatase SixA
MNLLVVAHTIAEDPATWSGRDDSERPLLTGEGQKMMKKAAKGLCTTGGGRIRLRLL